MINADNISRLPILSLIVNVEATADIVWNSFPGSVIHGIIGFRLKDLSCVVKHRDCQKCFLAQTCAYGLLYESPVPPDSKRMRLYPQTPHPIRITVYPWDKPVLAAGDTFDIGITLYGKAAAYSLMVLLSLEKSLAEGVGKAKANSRGKAGILKISDSLGNCSISWEELKIEYRNIAEPRQLSEISAGGHSGNVTLNFRSPLKITVNEKITFRPQPRDIAANLLRRIDNLSAFYGQSQIDSQAYDLIGVAENVEYASSLKRIEAIRYSSRQKKTISLSGALGSITIRSCPPELTRLFKMGEYIGIGKGTTMGLGDYRVVDLA